MGDLEARYYETLPAEYHDRMRGLGVGEWLPVDLAAAHYATYDALALTDEQIATICASAANRTHGVMLRALASIVRQVGGLSAPLLVRQLPRVWERSFRGGAFTTEAVGANEVRVRAVGLRPLNASPYFRAAMTQHYAVGLELFSKRSEVRVLSITADSYSARLTWQ